jgi:hypothetical protein
MGILLGRQTYQIKGMRLFSMLNSKREENLNQFINLKLILKPETNTLAY